MKFSKKGNIEILAETTEFIQAIFFTKIGFNQFFYSRCWFGHRLWSQGNCSRYRIQLGPICWRAGLGQDRGRPQHHPRGQEHHRQVAIKAIVHSSQNRRRDRQGTLSWRCLPERPTARWGPCPAGSVACPFRHLHPLGFVTPIFLLLFLTSYI